MRLHISEAAKTSTKQEADYYGTESGAALANRWRAAVDQAIRSLRAMPDRGALCRFPTRSIRDLRWIPIDGFPKHRLFYRHDEALATVFIVEVLHGMQNLESHLF